MFSLVMQGTGHMGIQRSQLNTLTLNTQQELWRSKQTASVYSSWMASYVFTVQRTKAVQKKNLVCSPAQLPVTGFHIYTKG